MLGPCDGIPQYTGYLERVRKDLATIDFPDSGPFQVRDVIHRDGANFLEFLEHTRAAVRRLVEHSPSRSQGGIDLQDACWRPENLKFVCVWT